MCQRRFWRRCISSAKLALVAGIVCALIFLITPSRETGEPEIKIGFVDMTRLFNEYHRTITLKTEFEAKWNKEQEEVDRRKADLEKLRQELEQKADTLSDEERRARQERFLDERANLRDYVQRKDLELRRDKEKDERTLLKELQTAVNKYGTRKGYSVIMDKSMLLHGGQSFDLTDEIIKDVNS